MTREEKMRVSWQVAKVMIEYPEVGRIILSQQMILQEVAESGAGLVEDRISGLMQLGVAMPFLEYWRERCPENPQELPPSLQCIATARSPRDCFRLRSDEWLEDPFTNRGSLPAKPPRPVMDTFLTTAVGTGLGNDE